MYGHLPIHRTDQSLNDTSKDFTVPNEVEWLLKAAYLVVTTTATVGNRLFSISLIDGTLVRYVEQALAIPASQTADVIHARIGILEPVETVAGQQYMGLPNIWVPPGWIIRVSDTAAVDAAADDMLVDLFLEQRSKVS